MICLKLLCRGCLMFENTSKGKSNNTNWKYHHVIERVHVKESVSLIVLHQSHLAAEYWTRMRGAALPIGEVGQVVGILQRHAVPLLVEADPGAGELQQPLHKLTLFPFLKRTKIRFWPRGISKLSFLLSGCNVQCNSKYLLRPHAQSNFH